MSSAVAEKKLTTSQRYGERFTTFVLEQEAHEIVTHYQEVYGISITKFLNSCVKQFDFQSIVNADKKINRAKLKKRVAKWVKPMLDSPLSEEETINLLTDKYLEILRLTSKRDSHTHK